MPMTQKKQAKNNVIYKTETEYGMKTEEQQA